MMRQVHHKRTQSESIEATAQFFVLSVSFSYHCSLKSWSLSLLPVFGDHVLPKQPIPQLLIWALVFTLLYLLPHQLTSSVCDQTGRDSRVPPSTIFWFMRPHVAAGFDIAYEAMTLVMGIASSREDAWSRDLLKAGGYVQSQWLCSNKGPLFP